MAFSCSNVVKMLISTSTCNKITNIESNLKSKTFFFNVACYTWFVRFPKINDTNIA